MTLLITILSEVSVALGCRVTADKSAGFSLWHFPPDICNTIPADMDVSASVCVSRD